MQKVTFTSSSGTITFTDDNTQIFNGKWAPYSLLDFDPNAIASTIDNATCIDMDGQHTIGAVLKPRSIKLTVGFDARGYYNNAHTGNQLHSGGDKGMYYFRRQLLTHFPLHEEGELTYENDIMGVRGAYSIKAKLTEYPGIERVCGTRCEVTFYLVADYPYWHRAVLGDIYTATWDNPAAVAVICEGDVDSPIIGTITCVSPIVGNTTGTFFKLWRSYSDIDSKMCFVKNLSAGQKIEFNTGINNEVYVHLIDTDGTVHNANHYVDYRNSNLLVNNVGDTHWQLNLYGTSGEYTIQMQYQLLYRAI